MDPGLLDLACSTCLRRAATAVKQRQVTASGTTTHSTSAVLRLNSPHNLRAHSFRPSMLGIGSLVASPTIDLSASAKSRPRTSSRVPSSNAVIPDQASPALTRTAVSLEYAALRYSGHCPLGMYVTPSTGDLLVWDAVFFVHQGQYAYTVRPTSVQATCGVGYYADSILKFRLTFPPNYPERPPIVQFLTDVFHPLISQQDGTFNLAPRFRLWRYVGSICRKRSQS